MVGLPAQDFHADVLRGQQRVEIVAARVLVVGEEDTLDFAADDLMV